MPLSRLALVLCCILISPALLGEPNEEKKVAFSSDLVECYGSTDDNGIYYLMPTKLTVNRSHFTGKSSFSWKDLQGQKALVNMVVQLFTGDELQLQALKQINRETRKRVKFKSIDIRNASIKINEPEELVSSQEFSSLGSSTFSRLQIKLVLTKDGAEAWKESISNGDSIVTTGRMSFEARFTNNAGASIWKPYDLALEIAGLPDPSKPRSDRDAISDLGKLEGEKYFWGQFANCENFIDATTFEKPSEAELKSTSEQMSADEKKLFLDSALAAFDAAVNAQKQACQEEVSKIKGEKWIKNYFTSQGIDCITKDLPKWETISILIQDQSEAFRLGSQRYYDKFKQEVCDKIPKVVEISVALDGNSIKNVLIKFSEPVKKETLVGNVVIYPMGHPELSYKEITIDKFEGDQALFHFNSPITKQGKYDTLEIQSGVVSARGRKLESATKLIEFP